MKKRLLTFLLIVCIVLSTLSGCGVAQSASSVETSPKENAPSESFFEDVEPYTTGSNQEWVLSSLSKLDNSEEKIRLYNYLLKAHTYLLLYDEKDYTDEYDNVKNMWLDEMSSSDKSAETRGQLQNMLDDENWIIDITYPVENLFQLNDEEFTQVYYYFVDANPQFFLGCFFPGYLDEEIGITPIICVPAYYAFADRRQETQNKIQNKFDDFKLQLEKSVDGEDQYNTVKYVYNHVIETMSYSEVDENYSSRAELEATQTIMGYFGDSKQTICKGYAAIMGYLLNRLGIPTIDQGGTTIERDENGEVIGMWLHAWNIVQLDGEWYFIDATWDIAGEYMWLLKGREENNDSDFLYSHAIAADMIYPEVSMTDYMPK